MGIPVGTCYTAVIETGKEIVVAVHAYLRVSKDDQTTENQRKMIADAGFAVDTYHSEDGVSGSMAAEDRPTFSAMSKQLQAGDTVVCTMVDRLGRSASDVLATVESFKHRNIRIRIMQFDGIDLTSSMGKMVLTMLAACAEFERNLIVERTVAGLARTKAQGTMLGSPLKVEPSTLEGMITDRAKGMMLKHISEKWGVALSSCDRLIKKWKDNIQGYKDEWEAREKQYNDK